MNYYNEIKNELINNEVYKKVKDYSKNRSDLKTYYNVGRLLSEAGKHYGENIIKKYSEKLTSELGKGYTKKSLFKYKKFYTMIEKVSTVSRQFNGIRPMMSDHLTWSHYDALLKFNNINEINYYIKIIEDQNLSVRELRNRIKSNEYERLDDKTKLKLINKEETETEDFIKNPILIKNRYSNEKITEKMLQQLILDDLPSFLKELGDGFCFVDNEYKIKMGNVYNYIDLLLFNTNFNHYTVVELKTTKLKKEHIGQIQTYMHYIDENVRKWHHNKTVGIIICKKNNKYIMAYCSDPKIISKEYELTH